MDTPATPPNSQLVPGRSCDGCTLCCRLLRIESLQKERLVECRHCDPGVACRIYADRPSACAEFYCTYRYSPELGEEWKPSHCHMVLNYDPGRQRVNVSVDPEFAGQWRREPYYSRLKELAQHMLRQRGYILVWEADALFVILPDRDVALGPAFDKVISVLGRTSPSGTQEYKVLALAPDDPRLADLRLGLAPEPPG